MSQSLTSRSSDLRALLDDGYEMEIKSGHLVIWNVPYVNSRSQVRRGALVSTLDLAGDVTTRPSTHVAMFSGEYPCDREGRELEKIRHHSRRQTICTGLAVDHSFSSKPVDGYNDYHHKMSTYVAIISSHAEALDPTVTSRTRRIVESHDPNSVFLYMDTASSRAGITEVSRKLEVDKIAIVGLGGTGSYLLDLISKTPVREIHVFDSDDFLQHNAFRSPGAASLCELRARRKKVHYHSDRYASMRRGVVPHDFSIGASNVEALEGMDFVFVCVDRGEAKRFIIDRLEQLGTSFIDVGIGIDLVEGELQGIVRVTTSTAAKREHIRDKNRISLSDRDEDGMYSRNIQIVELNALNAVLAVIRWKKILGFYRDFEREHHSTYTLDGNLIINDDHA